MNSSYSKMNHAEAGRLDVDRVLLLNLAVIFGTLIMLAAYIQSGAQSIVRGSELREAESRLAEISEQCDKLEMSLLANKSMASLGTRAGEMGFVPVEQVEYLNVGGSVALR